MSFSIKTIGTFAVLGAENGFRVPSLMTIFHELTILRRHDERLRIELRQVCGVELDYALDDIPSFRISEDDPRWECVSQVVRPHIGRGITQGTWTEFTHDECNGAPFLSMTAWAHGFPQPEDVLGFQNVSYDVSSQCPHCMLGIEQKGPFRFRRDPVWGRHSMLQLEWVPEEFFVRPEIYEEIFLPFGIAFRPVVLHRSGSEMNSVLQLVIPAISDVDVASLPFTECRSCGRKKYDEVRRGFYPLPVDITRPLMHSAQYFCTGFRLTLISNALYRKITQANLRGPVFRPCGSLSEEPAGGLR